MFGDVWGPGPSRVVALHGWMRTHADFARSVGPDAAGGALPVLAVDLPGFGASPPPREEWGSTQYATAVASLLSAPRGPGRPGYVAGIAPPVVVLGHSFGGRVAVRLAAARPDLVGALVLTGVPLVPRAAGRRPRLAYRAVRRLRKAGVVSEERLERARMRYGSEDYRRAQGVMRGVLVRTVNERYDDDLASLRCPVELVWGDDDDAAPIEVARTVAERVPGATLTVCPGAGHLTPLTVPGELRAAVERCLARR